MPSRQFCTPHLLATGSAQPLRRVAFDDNGFGESFYQKLLLEHPQLLPVDEIEPLFAPLLPLGREVNTPSGPVDVLYVSPEGYLTLVETKLWRNPQARREVVAQIIDYATAMSRWTYDQLRDAVKKAGATGDDPLVTAAREQPDFDQTRFIDTVSRNLSKGRFLLLIVGDGIQESVEHLADTLSRSPHLGFSLALVELALFRAEDATEPLFIQPRVLARTREIVRAVVEVRAPSSPQDVSIALPQNEGDGDGGKRRKLSEEVVLERIAATTKQETAEAFRDFLNQAEKLGIEIEGRDASVSLFWYEPNTGRRFSFGSVYCDGALVSLKFVVYNFRKAGLDEGIGMRYVRAVASLIPGATVRDANKDGKVWTRVFVSSREITLPDLLPHSLEWLKALEKVISETEAAAAARLTP